MSVRARAGHNIGWIPKIWVCVMYAGERESEHILRVEHFNGWLELFFLELNIAGG